MENTGKKITKRYRLNQYLARCGVCSRREADRLIAAGRVSVDGAVAQPGRRVEGTNQVMLDGRLLAEKKETAVLAYYKPVGVTCTEKDRFADKKITDVLQYKTRVTYAGRLDRDSEGLMIMTDDGQLIDAMMRGANRHEKEYVVKVCRELRPEFLEKMAAGVWLKELEQKTRPCEVAGNGKFTFRIVLTQGLNRQIRRMCRASGNEAAAIKRVRIMNVRLDGLRPGEYRELTGEERAELYAACGLSCR